MQNLSSTPKSLAFAKANAEPSFDSVARAASTAAICDMSVQVLCLSQDQLRRWRHYVDAPQFDGLELRVQDLNQATLAEWRATFGQRRADMTVLAGFHAARHREEISAEYADALIASVSEGLVVMA